MLATLHLQNRDEKPFAMSDVLPNGKPWPRISIVTPSFNHGHYIEETIKSILLQGYPNLEYAIIDGGSTDSTIEVIHKYEHLLSFWVSEKDQGQYDAINKGFAESSGEIMAWLNSDDVYMPWTLQTVAEIFSEFPQVDWIMGLPSQIQANAVHNILPCNPFPRQFIECGLFRGGDWGIIQQESCFWRRKLWQQAGPLQLKYALAGDFELWSRFARYSDLVSVNTLLGGFSVHGTNRSIINRTGYMSEVDTIIDAMPLPQREKRKKLIKAKAVYDRVQSIPIIRRLIRRGYQLDDYEGAILRRDVTKNRYVLERRPYSF